MWEKFKRQVGSGGSGQEENVSSYTKIMGKAVAAAEQMREYIKKKNSAVEQSGGGNGSAISVRRGGKRCERILLLPSPVWRRGTLAFPVRR